MPYGSGSSSAISWTAPLLSGQVVIGSTAGNPAAGTITSSNGTIDIILGSNTINLEVDDTVATSFTTDSGSAVPVAGVLQVLGGTGCGTTGATNIVTVNLDAAVPISFPTDSGTATPAANALTIAGGTLLNTSGAGATATINADGNVVGSVVTDSGTVTPATNAFSIVGVNGITTSGATSIVTIDGAAITGGLTWNVITAATDDLEAFNGYFANHATSVTFTLPATASVGDTFEVVTMHATGTFIIAQNASQSIQVGNVVTTTGVGGSLTSTDIGDWIQLVCNVTDVGFFCNIKQGNVTAV